MFNITVQRQHLSSSHKTSELDPLSQSDLVCMQQYAYSTLNYRMYFYAAVLSLVVLYVWMSVYVEHEPRHIPITR